MKIITIGGCGSNIAMGLLNDNAFRKVSIDIIDSVIPPMKLDDFNHAHVICIQDAYTGSGRDRERAKALFMKHSKNAAIEKLYKEVSSAINEPVFVITSTSGGTGSGAVTELLKQLVVLSDYVIPVLVAPNDNDVVAYHMNTNDLFCELGELDSLTYMLFKNPQGDDYTEVNAEIIDALKVVCGMKFSSNTSNATIDESDLRNIISTPGRLIATSCTAGDIDTLKRDITRKVLSSKYQPGWKPEDVSTTYHISGFGLESRFAEQDHSDVFNDIRKSLPNSFDEYKFIKNTSDNNTNGTATVIVAGLPNNVMKAVDDVEFNEASKISNGLKKSTRPSFNKRKQKIVESHGFEIVK